MQERLPKLKKRASSSSSSSGTGSCEDKKGVQVPAQRKLLSRGKTACRLCDESKFNAVEEEKNVFTRIRIMLSTSSAELRRMLALEEWRKQGEEASIEDEASTDDQWEGHQVLKFNCLGPLISLLWIWLGEKRCRVFSVHECSGQFCIVWFLFSCAHACCYVQEWLFSLHIFMNHDKTWAEDHSYDLWNDRCICLHKMYDAFI